jgi:bacterioferritin (cytochrome b1)
VIREDDLMEAPHYLDNLFATGTNPSKAAQQFIKLQKVQDAFAKALKAEAEARQNLAREPRIIGPGPGQTGRNVFLELLNETELAHNYGN